MSRFLKILKNHVRLNKNTNWIREMAELKQFVNYEVARTGKLQQYYTLYRHSCCTMPGVFSHESYCYIRNLSHDLDEAIKKAEKIAGKAKTVEYVESPKAEYDNFTAFGLKWKNGHNCYFSYPNNDFWAIWRDNKEMLKKVGFWVSKSRNGEFMAFCRLDASYEIIGGLSELPELKTDYPTIENGRQELTGKLVKVNESYSEEYETLTIRATFELENGYKVNGTLPKRLSNDDIGETFRFNGTIEDQGKGFGFYKRPAKVAKI